MFNEECTLGMIIKTTKAYLLGKVKPIHRQLVIKECVHISYICHHFQHVYCVVLIILKASPTQTRKREESSRESEGGRERES